MGGTRFACFRNMHGEIAQVQTMERSHISVDQARKRRCAEPMDVVMRSMYGTLRRSQLIADLRNAGMCRRMGLMGKRDQMPGLVCGIARVNGLMAISMHVLVLREGQEEDRRARDDAGYSALSVRVHDVWFLWLCSLVVLVVRILN